MTEEGLNTGGMTEGPPCPSVIPAGPLCHSRRLLAGIQCLAFLFLALLFLYSCGPCMGEAMDSRLKTSGMTEGGLKASGMTEGMLCLFVIPPASLSYRQSPLSFPPGPFVMPAGLSLSCRRAPSVIPAGFLCHSRRPPLSFPPVSPITNVGDKVSGNPGSCFVVLLFVWPLHGGKPWIPD